MTNQAYPPVKCVLFDLDGTLYLGGKKLPGASELLQSLKDNNLNFGFMTNNSSIAPPQYLEKLLKLGFDAKSENIITSAQATLLMLDELKLGSNYYILATTAFREYLAQNGYNHDEDNPAAVLLGFDQEFDYHRFTAATRCLDRGLPLLASHPDVVCPTPDGPLPDAGAILAAFKAATGVTPLAIAGKPNKWIVELACRNFNCTPAEIIVIGDRLATDIRTGCEHNMRTVCVLSGVTKRQDIPDSPWRPALVVDSVADLVDMKLFAQQGWL